MIKKLYTLSLLVLTFVSHLIQAQAVLEVATKTINKQFPYSSKGTIILNGENATVKIDSWDKDEVKIKLKLITKHRIKTIAISELDNIKYLIDKKDNDIYLRNYFLSKSELATGCILKVEYEITVPVQTNFIIKNNLGNVEIKNTEGKFDVEAKFGNINLSDVKGNIGINLSLGDIQADRIDGTITIKANNSEITMEDLLGKYHLTLVSSDLFFRPINHIELLNIKAKNGDVNLLLNSNDIYNYTFNTLYGKIKVPDTFKAKVANGDNKSFLKYSMNNTNSLVFINSDFGNITLTNNLTIK